MEMDHKTNPRAFIGECGILKRSDPKQRCTSRAIPI